MQITHAVVIRMHYKENDARFEWRLNYFKIMVLPRLKKQKGSGPFDICIWCNEWHEQEFLKLGLKTFRPEKERADHRRGYWIDFTPWKKIIGLEKYDIQSGLDSDDLVAPDYIKTIEQAIESNSGGKPMHLSFQPEYFDLKNLQKKKMRTRYSQRMGSMFFSIYQPAGTENYIFAYEHSHLQLWKYLKKSIILPPGKCWLSVHGLNESTTIK